MEELRFVAQHVKHVVFESGIDTLDLSVLKQKHAPNGFSIIHEHSGGLQKHENPSEAFSTILDVLHPQNGMFITTSPIDVLPGAVADIQNHGFTLYREIISQQKLFKEAYIITGSEAPVDAFMTTLLTY